VFSFKKIGNESISELFDAFSESDLPTGFGEIGKVVAFNNKQFFGLMLGNKRNQEKLRDAWYNYCIRLSNHESREVIWYENEKFYQMPSLDEIAIMDIVTDY
jgi:hypothetical protein